MIDWEMLKAAGPFMRRELLSDAWPAILAQHEQDQKVIEAAKKLRDALKDLMDDVTNPSKQRAIGSSIYCARQALAEFNNVVKP